MYNQIGGGYTKKMKTLIEKEIVKFLKEKKIIKQKDVENKFNLSLSTARRYLIKLENDGFVKRTFGEIIYIDNVKSNIENNANKNILVNIDAKKKIANVASKLIKGYKTIYLDSGSSCYYLLDYIDKDITIYTNSIMNAKRAIDMGFKNVNIIGGTIKQETMAIVDIDMDFINKINFQISFMGVNGIDEKGCITTPEKKEGITKKHIANRSELIVLLAEKNKIYKKSLYDFSPTNKDTKVITVTDHKNISNKIGNILFIYV